jgi:flagellar biosynthesis/type III secretory pathway protein FliH
VEEKFSGIYYVIGNVLFPTQIVVTKQLRKETHSSLRVLAKNAEGDDVRRFIEESNKLMEQGDRHNIDAVLEVSTAANEALYEEVRRMFMMGPALRRLMKEDIDSAIADGRAQGMAQGMADGMAQGSYTTELSNIRNLMDSMKWTVEQAMDALKVPEEKREKYLEELK